MWRWIRAIYPSTLHQIGQMDHDVFISASIIRGTPWPPASVRQTWSPSFTRRDVAKYGCQPVPAPDGRYWMFLFPDYRWSWCWRIDSTPQDFGSHLPIARSGGRREHVCRIHSPGLASGRWTFSQQWIQVTPVPHYRQLWNTLQILLMIIMFQRCSTFGGLLHRRYPANIRTGSTLQGSGTNQGTSAVTWRPLVLYVIIFNLISDNLLIPHQATGWFEGPQGSRVQKILLSPRKLSIREIIQHVFRPRRLHWDFRVPVYPYV